MSGAESSSRGGGGPPDRLRASSMSSSLRRAGRPGTASTAGDGINDQFERLSVAPSTAPSVAPSARSRISNNRSPSRPASSSFSDARPDVQRRQPSVRIRRKPVEADRRDSTNQDPSTFEGFPSVFPAPVSQTGRPRSISQPERGHYAPADVTPVPRAARRVAPAAMPRLTEEGTRPTMEELGVTASSVSPAQSLPELDGEEVGGEEVEDGVPPRNRMPTMRRVSRLFWPGGSRRQEEAPERLRRATIGDEYAEELVDWLDIIDPEVQTLSTLTNVQNTLFVPDLGNWLNRRPTYTLSQRDAPSQRERRDTVSEQPVPAQAPAELEPLPEVVPEKPEEPESETGRPQDGRLQRSNTISSRLTESHYAALPHGHNLEGWTAEEKWELDDHVRHMLHSRRSRFKRTMKGFGQYVRRPLGFIVTLYATLITLFGLAWVLFLIGWIYVPSKQDYDIFVIDSVLVALFACMGIGLAPFRAVDTYRLIFILRYTRIIENAKKGKWPRPRSRLQKRSVPEDVRVSMDKLATGRVSSHMSDRPLPPTPGTDFQAQPYYASDRFPPPPEFQTDVSGHLQPPGSEFQPEMDPPTGVLTRNSTRPFPELDGDIEVDLEDGEGDESLYPDPLTPKQRKRFEHHKKKLARSHSFYKPTETFTHFPFPMSYLIAIVILVDCHSCLQISLSSCTWGINYHVRPFALTTVILCVSITCNITAGIVIMTGDRKTRKKEVWNLLNRQELTGDAIKHLEQKREKEHKKQAESEASSSRERTLLGTHHS